MPASHEVGEEEPTPVRTLNEYMLGHGQNLPNHSTALAGRAAFVTQRVATTPCFRTKQEAYRYAAYLLTMAEAFLPDEEGSETHTFEVVLDACRNS